MKKRFHHVSAIFRKSPQKGFSDFSYKKGVGTPDERLDATSSLVRVYSNATPGQTAIRARLREDKYLLKNYKYRSVQTTIDEQSAQQIVTKNLSLIPDYMLGVEGREKVPHITIQYGLEEYNQAKFLELYQFISKMRPFYITLGPVRKFPGSIHSSYDCPVWISLISGVRELSDIRDGIRKIVRVKDSFPSYIPHINIAYVKKEYADRFVGNTSYMGMRILIDSVDLCMRDGSRIKVPLNGNKPRIVPNLVRYLSKFRK